jgi:hypothetical protein
MSRSVAGRQHGRSVADPARHVFLTPKYASVRSSVVVISVMFSPP